MPSAQVALQGDDGLFLEGWSSRQDEVGRQVVPEMDTFNLDIHEELTVVEKQRRDRTAGARVRCEFRKHVYSIPWQIVRCHEHSTPDGA